MRSVNRGSAAIGPASPSLRVARWRAGDDAGAVSAIAAAAHRWYEPDGGCTDRPVLPQRFINGRRIY